MQNTNDVSVYSKFGVFLDGKKIESNNDNLVFLESNGVTYSFHQRHFKIGNFSAIVYTDFCSRVELFSQSFDSSEDLTLPSSTDHLLFTLCVRESFLVDCVLSGANHMTGVNLESCYLSETDFTNQTLRLAGPIKGLKVHGCSFDDFHVSDYGRFHDSYLTNVTYCNDDDDDVRSPYKVSGSRLNDCHISGNGENEVYNAILRYAQISYNDCLWLNNVTMTNVAFNVDDINIQNKFGFFTIPLPKTLLHIYTNRQAEMCVVEDSTDNHMTLTDPKLNQKLESLLLANGEEMPEDIARYVKDCMVSRENILLRFYKLRTELKFQ